MAKKDTKKVIVDKTESLASVVAESINNSKNLGKEKLAHFLDEDVFLAANTELWVPTGAVNLDLAISNRPHGGYPVGRIVEITGLEATGKSLLAAHALAETQKAGGLAVFIDTENAVSREFFEALGVDISSMIYIENCYSLEKVYETVEEIINIVKEKSKKFKNLYCTIVVDSVAGVPTKAELEGTFDQQGWNTGKAIINSMALRKLTSTVGNEKVLLIFTNQLRSKLGVAFGDPWTTSGGKALAFHASVRLRIKSMKQIKGKDKYGNEVVVGISTRVQVIKNRVGPPLRSADFDIYFSSGIDANGGMLDMCVNYEIVTKPSVGWFEYIHEDSGEITKFRAKEFRDKILSNETFNSDIYTKICERYIMTYAKKEDLGLAELSYVDEEGKETPIDNE